MPKSQMPKFFSSIFAKLLLVIFIAGLGINVAIIFFFAAFRHHVVGAYQPHLNRYVDYLLNDLGDPPNQDRARQIAADTHMIIAYQGAGQSWSTSDTSIDAVTQRLHLRHQSERLQAGSHHGAYVVQVKQGEGHLTFYLPHQTDAETKIKVISFCLLLYITILMTAAYFVIRWILKPLRWLKHGVKQVAQGELSHRVPLIRSDELSDLSDSFNTMTERLQQLIQSKEQLLLDVSHELRTPITRVKVALAMMPDSPDRQSIEEDLKEMERKITELLETARSLNIKASLNNAPTDLVGLIRDSVQQCDTRKPAVILAPMPELGIMRLDEKLIRKALKNIIDNAQKYSSDDGPPVRVSLSLEETDIIIAIQDHGVGISQEDLGFVFEPFYRADKARSPRSDGFGLGLSMAKNIIEAHGGCIVIHSELHQGTLVKVYLPRRPTASENSP